MLAGEVKPRVRDACVRSGNSVLSLLVFSTRLCSEGRAAAAALPRLHVGREGGGSVRHRVRLASSSFRAFRNP